MKMRNIISTFYSPMLKTFDVGDVILSTHDFHIKDEFACHTFDEFIYYNDLIWDSYETPSEK